MVRRRITFLAKAEYFTGTGLKGWFKRWFYTAAGQVPIDRTDADSAQAALETAARLLNEGKLLGMYPEGTRSPDGRLYKGKTGMARVALRDRCQGHPRRDDRHRRGQPARAARCGGSAG